MDNSEKDLQVSPGELGQSCAKKAHEGESLSVKEPTGEIIPSLEAPCEFKTIRESVEELDPREIRPVLGIPDYRERTRSLNPIVVKSPDICYCLDGGEMIQRTLVEGRASILCYVSHVSKISELEAAIRKAAIRTFPQGGEACYGEIIRNTGILFDMILSSTENPVVFSHGGPRWKGMGASNNGEENVRHLLAARTGKSIVTIDKHLSFREYLNEGAFRVLIESEKDKEFFEKAQKPKKLLLRKLISEEQSEDTIRSEISAAMIRMAEDPTQIEIIAETLSRPPVTDAPPESTPRPASHEPSEFKHWTGSEASEITRITEQDIRLRIIELGKRIVGLGEDESLSFDALQEEFEKEVGEAIALGQDIASLLEQDESNPLEVAV